MEECHERCKPYLLDSAVQCCWKCPLIRLRHLLPHKSVGEKALVGRCSREGAAQSCTRAVAYSRVRVLAAFM